MLYKGQPTGMYYKETHMLYKRLPTGEHYEETLTCYIRVCQRDSNMRKLLLAI